MCTPHLILCFSIFTVLSAQSKESCVGRCGQGYFRANPCQCDYTCMSYMECCPDFRTVCTTEGSCKGRCHEGFIRGQTCDCDPSCVTFGKCCPDYKEHCIKPTQKPSPPPPPRRPDPDPRDDTPKPTKRPEERVPEDLPEDPSEKRPQQNNKMGKKSPKVPKKKSKTIVESEEEIEDPKNKIPRNEGDKPKKHGDPSDPEIPPKDDENDDENVSSNPKNTKKRSPANAKKNSRKPSSPSPRGDTDENVKPKKGKSPKKKPSGKYILKKKKKVNSEEEEQEMVESEFSSSSQSSSSHSRSKSSRRLTGKKKLKDKKKKKIPGEDSEEPLMPPKKKKEKYPFTTPEPDEGSGDYGSGTDVYQTTALSSTVTSNIVTKTTTTTTVRTSKPEGTIKPSINPVTERSKVSSNKTTPNVPSLLSTEKQASSTTEVPLSSTQQDKTKGLSTTTNTPPQEMSTMKTPQDQSTTGQHLRHTTNSPALQKTTMSYHSKPLSTETNTGTTIKQTTSDVLRTTTLPITSKGQGSEVSPTTLKSRTLSSTDSPMKKLNSTENYSQTTKTMFSNDATVYREPKATTKLLDDQMEKLTTPFQSVKKTTGKPDKTKTTEQTTTTALHTNNNTTQGIPSTTKETPSIKKIATTASSNLFTSRPVDDNMNNSTATTTQISLPSRICDLIKEEAIQIKISGSDLQHIIHICNELERQYLTVNTPTPQSETTQSNLENRNMPPRSPVVYGTPALWNKEPRIIQIVEEINRRINPSPIINITRVPIQYTYNSTAWLLLLNKIRHTHDPEMNLCIGPPADGMTTLQNGTVVVFRGKYFWTLNQGGVTGPPRKISEVWGVPSPIDTVFTRCNCGGKTFFFKGPHYWRFTNDIMDRGYPKQIVTGFGGLTGRVNAVLSVAGIKTRPESVYFFKSGGKVQKYTFRQEQTKRCTKKKTPTVNYPVYSQKVQTVRFRFPRNIIQHRIKIHRTFTNIRQPLGILHEETSVRLTWRGVPNNIISAVSLPNFQKQDGFDYYVFTKEKYYNINMSSKVAVKPPPQAEQKTTKDWYKCKE